MIFPSPSFPNSIGERPRTRNSIATLLFIVPLLTACSAVTAEKMARIKPAMKPAEVEAILGRPATIEHSESATTDITGEVDYYPCPNGQGRVIYVNNSVFKAEFVPEKKS